MATTNNDQTTINTGENTATVNTNADQTVGNTTADEKPKSTDSQPSSADTKAVNEPTNTVPVDLPPDLQPLATNTPAVDNPINLQPVLTNTATTVSAVNNQPVTFQISSEETTPKPVNDTVVVDNPTNVEPQASKQSPTTDRIPSAALVKIRKSYKGLIILGIVFIISLLEIIIGWNYADECPVHWRIPHYLVVAGTVGLIGVALIIVQNLLTLHISSKSNNPSFIFVCGSLGLVAVCIFLFLFSIGWFIAGCIWVFRVWNKVQYQTRKRSDYCHSTLYRFAFWLLFFTICCILLLGYRIINQIRQRINDKKKGPAIPVPTVEV